jgi:thiol-disulfide isomerase/thioredoxin
MVAVAVLLASGVVGFLLYRLTAPSPATLRVAAPATVPAAPASGVPPPAAAAPAARAPVAEERRIPDELPDFSLPDLDGIARRLSDWKGRALVVNFWATWCEPCRREIPLLESLRREHARQGLEVIGIAVDYRDPVLKFARQMGIDYPVLVGDKGGLEAVTAFGMDTVLPFSVFADRRGRIVALKVGELHRDEADFILERVRQIDSGRLPVAEARQQIASGIARLAAARAKAAPAAAQ